MGILTWLTNVALSQAGKKAIERLSKQTLMSRLQSAAEKWSRELPESALLLSVDSILVPKLEVSLKETPPPIRRVVAKLEKFEIPTAADWQADFMIQWNWVRKNLSGRAPFFDISQESAERYLFQLGQSLELECKKDPTYFQVTALSHLTAMSDGQENFVQKMDEVLWLLRSQQQQSVAAPQPIYEETSSGDGYHAEIDTAADYLKTFQPDIAIAQLNLLKNRKWDQLTEREKFRILANLGHAHLAKNILREAGDYFIRAKQHQPLDEQARSLEALGFSLKGDRAKAFELASSIRADFPTCDLASATWVRNAPCDMQFQELEASIPADVRDGVETSSALAWRALELNELDAAEAYARTALSYDPLSLNLKEPLGTILIHGVCSSMLGQFCDVPFIENPATLDEAVTLLTEVFTQIPDALVGRKSFIRFQLGRADLAKGQASAAEAHFLFAWEHQPENPDYARQYAICLNDRKEFSRAIEVLESTSSRDESGKNALLSAEIRIERNADGDLKAAFDLLDALRPDLASYETPIRFEILHTLIFVCFKREDEERAKDILNHTDPEDVTPFVHSLLKSIYQRRASDLDASQKSALTALEQITPDTPLVLKRMMALHLERLGFKDESLALWKEIVRPTWVGFDTIDVLRLAKQCDDAAFVRDFCRELRRNGHFDRDAIHLEINTLLEHNCFETAIAAMKEILAAIAMPLLKKEVQLRLSHLGVAIGDPAIIVFEPTQLPSVEDCDPILGITMVEVLTKSSDQDVAVRFAYELVRRHFGSSIAHRAMVISVMARSGPKTESADPESVTPGCAVKYTADDTSHEEWFVIEDGVSPDAARLEFPPTHVLAVAMLGKRRGEQFELRADPRHPRTATIIDIWTKHKFRFNKCVEDWERRFPEEFFLWQFPIKQLDDGNPCLDDIFRSIDERIEETKRRDEIYRNNPLSTTSYSLATQISVLDAVRHLSSQVDLPIRCCLGNDTETNGALRALRNGRPLIIDATALASLFLTELYLRLPEMNLSFVVSEGTLLEWHRTLIAAERVPADGGFLSKEKNRYVYYANNEDEWKRYCDSLRSFLEMITSVARIEEGMPLTYLDRDSRRQLVAFLGRPAAESIGIAAHRGYAIWTDDRWVGELAANQHQVPRVWTGIATRWASDEKKIAEAECSRVTLDLLRMGYIYTQIDPRDFKWAGNSDNWSPSGARLSLCLRWLANPHTKDIGILQVGLSAMKAVCRDAEMEFARTTLVFRIEQAISNRPDGVGILRRLFRAVDAESAFDPAAAEVKDILLKSESVRAFVR